MRARLLRTTGVQCPACGKPVETVEFGRTPDDAGYGLRLDCDHIVTLEMARDAWGLDIPDPDPTRVALPSDPDALRSS